MGTNWLWNWRWTVIKTIKMMPIRPPMTNVKMTVRADCAVSACSPLPASIKALAHWLSVGGVGLWTGLCPSPARLPASEIKQTSLPTNLASLLALEWRAARPHFRLQFLALNLGLLYSRDIWLPGFSRAEPPWRRAGMAVRSRCSRLAGP